MDRPTIAPDIVPPNQEKPQLREQLLAARAALGKVERANAQARIATALQAELARGRPGVLGTFWPIRGEPELGAAWQSAQAAGWTLALPVVQVPHTPLVFRRWDGLPPAARDACGVRVPPEDAPVLMPDTIVIPCLGFHPDGFRLGYGGGYYDRSFAARTRPLRLIGVAFEAQACRFEPDAHDLRLDLIVTEHGVRTWR